ncbi:MAG: sigma 54-interacting transcriptional regulator [Deltaproteobacteria bacterium]|nr:sigma 54-interacting transcriptional regulator [Deltaproteobacteria bacterium]
MERYHIIVVDDERPVRKKLIKAINNCRVRNNQGQGKEDITFSLNEAASLADVKRLFKELEIINKSVRNINKEAVCVVLDHRLEHENGLDVAWWLKKNCFGIYLIALSGYHEENYKSYMEIGAKVVDKDIDGDFYNEIQKRVTSWLRSQCGANNDHIANRLQELIGARSEAMVKVVNITANFAREEVPGLFALLISGEYGSGKNYLAEMVHKVAVENDFRSGIPQIVNIVASVNTQDIRAALFGSRLKDNNIEGAFPSAKGGTVIVDEVGSYPAAIQDNLLTAISPGWYRPLFGEQEKNEAWVILTTNHPEKVIEELRDRCVCLGIPSLLERQEDVPSLLEKLFSKLAPQYHLGVGTKLDLHRYEWKNVRQMEKVILETVKAKKARGDGSLQVGPDEIVWPDSDDLDLSSQVVREKTGEKQKTEGHNNWWSELDRDQLMRLCTEIWETQGKIIENDVKKIPDIVSKFSGHPWLYVRAMLAIFWRAHKDHEEVLTKELFEKIFGFTESNHYRGWLKNKGKTKRYSKIFPKRHGKIYGVVTHLEPDGYELKQNGMALNVGDN